MEKNNRRPYEKRGEGRSASGQYGRDKNASPYPSRRPPLKKHLDKGADFSAQAQAPAHASARVPAKRPAPSEGRPMPVQTGHPSPAAQEEDFENGAVSGRNAVKELLKNGRPVDKLFVQKGEREGSIVVLVAMAIERGIPVVEAERQKLDILSGYTVHQGVVAMAAEKEYCTVDDILEIARERGEKPFILIADEIMDPHNLGALIRSADGAGVHGVIITKRRAVGISPTVSKAAAGATEHMAIARVANIINTIEQLKKAGVWIFATDSSGKPYFQTDFNTPCALILGNEGNGISPSIKAKSDFLVSVPMRGKVESLNVSGAGAVIMFEAARQLTKI